MNNLPSFIFAGVLLFLFLFTNGEKQDLEKPAFSVNAEATSLAVYDPLMSAVEASDLPISVNAAAAYLKEIDRREIFVLEAARQWPLASLTKMMAAVVSQEKIGREQRIILSQQAILTEGSAGDFRVGEEAAAQELVKAMMVVSSNDAAAALAEFLRLGNFTDAMNAKARELQMLNTAFFDPSGLNLANQSTLYDIEKLVRYILAKHPEIFVWSRQKELDIAGRRLKNINKFAGQPDFLGGKTGFLEEANGNLVSLFQHQDKTVLIVVLGAEDRFEETEKLWTYYKSSGF